MSQSWTQGHLLEIARLREGPTLMKSRLVLLPAVLSSPIATTHYSGSWALFLVTF